MPSQAPDFAHLTGHGKIPLNQPPLGVEISLFVESFGGIYPKILDPPKWPCSRVQEPFFSLEVPPPPSLTWFA